MAPTETQSDPKTCETKASESSVPPWGGWAAAGARSGVVLWASSASTKMADLPLSTPVKQWGLLSWNERWMTYDGVTIKYAHSPSLILRASAALDTPRCRVFAPRAGLIALRCPGSSSRRRRRRQAREPQPPLEAARSAILYIYRCEYILVFIYLYIYIYIYIY